MNVKRILLSVLTAGFAIAVIGCNTVEGLGRDVESLGDAIEDAADED
jgi:predicted small secreted protein